MTLPTFLGIGTPRSGSTWLATLLARHPDVFVSQKMKEVHYFDRYYDRGIKWYEEYFPNEEEARRYLAIGEVTPHYLYDKDCPERIGEMKSIERLVVILRNPIDRAYSHFVLRSNLDNYQRSFDDFLSDYPTAIEWGFYYRNLKRYIDRFGAEQILVLVHEHVFTDIEASRKRIAEFLGVDPARFPDDAGVGRVNRGLVTRFRRTRAIVKRVGRVMRDRDMGWAFTFARKIGLKKLFLVEGGEVPPMLEETRVRLREVFREENQKLADLLGVDLSHWN